MSREDSLTSRNIFRDEGAELSFQLDCLRRVPVFDKTYYNTYIYRSVTKQCQFSKTLHFLFRKNITHLQSSANILGVNKQSFKKVF